VELFSYADLKKEGKRKCMRKTNLARAIPRRGV